MILFQNNDSTEVVSVIGNQLKITTHKDFQQGQLFNLEYADRIGDGALRLKKAGRGEWLSPVFETGDFNDLIASWNTDTPKGTSVEIFGRAYIPEYDGWVDREGKEYDGWTDWITWGEWSPFIARSCPECMDGHPRKDSEEQNGWAYAYSFTGGGDSSLLIRGEYTAKAFQLKAVLRAVEEAEAMPVLRLLYATWKNTNDENWWDACTYNEEPVVTPPAMLLETPAISQRKRDPDYGGVICSATSITMLMNGLGADILPEDTTLMNFDYGFGGNGNWSFTTAAAGAFGYESYVSYSSFDAIRQEITKGYGVGLSVKYSKDPDGKHPYLENAPCNVGGHLITIVGYYFNEDLGEYVYLSNDPAGNSDKEVAHREYRESQLSRAWYRRATYFLHEKEKHAGAYARTYVDAALQAVEGQENTFALYTAEGQVKIPVDFGEGRRKVFGQHGTICYFIEGDETELPCTCRRSTANHVFRYDGFTITEEGYLRFDEAAMELLFAEGRGFTLYVIDNSGTMYTAQWGSALLSMEEPETEWNLPVSKPVATGLAIGAGVALVGAAAGLTYWLLKKKKK